jgi:nucleoid-associated protein YgaU
MSELISNPQSEAEPQWAGRPGRVANDGPDGLQHPGLVIRYDAVTDLSDRPEEPEPESDPDAGEGEDEEPESASGTGARGRIRAVLGALPHGLLALTWAGLRAAYRYPRWALVIVLSVVILGATALTRPGKPTPKAEIPGKGAAAASNTEGEKAPAKDKTDPKEDRPAVADAGPAPASKPEGAPKGVEKEREASAPPPALDPSASPTAPKVADAGSTKSAAAEKAPPAISPPATKQEPVPAPPALNDHARASNVAALPARQEPATTSATAPAPTSAPPATTSPGTQEPAPTPAAELAGPNPGLPALPASGPEPSPPPTATPPVPTSPGAQGPAPTPAELAGPNPGLPTPTGSGPEPGPPPVSASATPATGQSAESASPAPGAGAERSGGAAAGSATPPALTPVGAAGGAEGSDQQPAAPLDTGPQPPPTGTQSEQPAPGSSPAGPASPPPSGPDSPSPLTPVTPPAGLLESPAVAPKPEPLAPASAPGGERGHDEAVKVGENKAEASSKGEAVQPATPNDKSSLPGGEPPPAAGGAKISDSTRVVPSPVPKEMTEPDRPSTASLPLVNLAGSTPGPGVSGHERMPGEKGAVGEANEPNPPKGEDRESGREEGAGHAPGTTGPLGTMTQPEAVAPKTGGSPLPEEKVPPTVPARPEESPSPAPASEGQESKAPERPARDDAGAERPGALTSERPGSPVDSSGKPEEGGWVRIPNKGRIPPDLGGDLVASGEAARSGADPAPGRRGRADAGVDLESGSPAHRSGDGRARALGRPAAQPTDRGPADAGTSLSEGTRAGARPSRVETSIHVVERGENFWTISRLFYGDGRYYRALWKANSDKYPDIRKIHINDVIYIPPVEDLDPAYIDRPRRPVAGRDEGPAREDVAGAEGSGPAGPGTMRSFPTTRTAERTDAPQGDPGRQSERVDAALELPVGDGDTGPARDGRGRPTDRLVEEESGGPGVRLTARPRGAAPLDRPMYKVRRYDTLRSIARDVLGDPRRADELYDLNRDIIADPTRLAPGQLLELPEDADTRRLTARDRYRGRE